MSRRRSIWTAVAAVAVLVAAVGLYWFQPWKLFIDHRVNEALPPQATEAIAVADAPVTGQPPSPGPSTSTTSSGPSSTATTSSGQSSTATPATTANSTRLLSRGRLISHEHDTSGTVSVIRLEDGSQVLTIADLDTSDGPDVRIWLSDQPVKKGEAGWYVFGKGKHIDLGGLKGNLGNQVYKIPAGTDLTRLTSVTIWCQRFDVSFGAAALMPV